MRSFCDSEAGIKYRFRILWNSWRLLAAAGASVLVVVRVFPALVFRPASKTIIQIRRPRVRGDGFVQGCLNVAVAALPLPRRSDCSLFRRRPQGPRQPTPKGRHVAGASVARNRAGISVRSCRVAVPRRLPGCHTPSRRRVEEHGSKTFGREKQSPRRDTLHCALVHAQ